MALLRVPVWFEASLHRLSILRIAYLGLIWVLYSSPIDAFYCRSLSEMRPVLIAYLSAYCKALPNLRPNFLTYGFGFPLLGIYGDGVSIV